jgi:hypothetical protein
LLLGIIIISYSRTVKLSAERAFDPFELKIKVVVPARIAGTRVPWTVGSESLHAAWMPAILAGMTVPWQDGVSIIQESCFQLCPRSTPGA